MPERAVRSGSRFRARQPSRLVSTIWVGFSTRSGGLMRPTQCSGAPSPFTESNSRGRACRHGILPRHFGEPFAVKGRFEESVAFYQRALAIQEKALGPNSFNAAVTLGDIGKTYHQAGLPDKGEPFLKRALAAFESINPADYTTGTAALYLGGVYLDQHRGDLAEPMLKKALLVYEQALGPDNPQTGAALNALAILYADLGRPRGFRTSLSTIARDRVGQRGAGSPPDRRCPRQHRGPQRGREELGNRTRLRASRRQGRYAGRFGAPGAERQADLRATSGRETPLPIGT